MAKHINPIGRVISGPLEHCFLFWLIDKDGTEYFVISPNQSIRIGAIVRLEDNPIKARINKGDVVRAKVTDEAFLHEDLELLTKNSGKITFRLNKQASEKLQSWAKR